MSADQPSLHAVPNVPSLKISRSESRRKASRRAARSDARALGVVAQVRTAFRRRHLLATAIGALLGGFVPLIVFTVAHHELSLALPTWRIAVGVCIVAAGLMYSAKTVCAWGRMAFGDGAKAVGFTVLVEGAMTFSGVAWLSYAALAYLVAINAIATGCTLVSSAPKTAGNDQ
jgi:VIT1/CCC1 family predicted Fe2+/Mn2+ transporter